MTLNMPEGGNGEACEGCGFTDMHMTTTCLARQNAALRARVAELESTRQLAPPPVNAGEVAGAWVPLTGKQISWACDKHNVLDPLERYYFCSGLREGYAMRPVPSVTDAEPAPKEAP